MNDKIEKQSQIIEKAKIYQSDIKESDRECLPLMGPGNYRVRDGIIWTKAIEINATRHCNLSCRGCSHLSPLEEHSELQPEEIKNSLSILSDFLKAETVRIVGGEPLLHSDLQLLICAVRKSGIAERVCLVTNGILLDQTDEKILSSLDEIQVSLYPLSEQMLSRIRNNIEKAGNVCHKVKVLKYSSFRESVANNITEDASLCTGIYETCQIAHVWRCITVDQGFLYRCPQSMALMSVDGLKEKANDRLKINAINKSEDVLYFLENNNPLKSCAKCLGSVGNIFKHEQVNKKLWLRCLPWDPEAGIDYEFMDKLKKNARDDNNCMKIRKTEENYHE